MSDSQSDALDAVEFYPEGLLHKFGFGDGDKLYDLVEEHGLGVDHRDLLVAVVERLVVPCLDQVVETYTLVSFHNPIRAGIIDGEKADIHSTLTPVIVEVPVAEIIGIARDLPLDGEAEDELIAPPGTPRDEEATLGVADERPEEIDVEQSVADSPEGHV